MCIYMYTYWGEGRKRDIKTETERGREGERELFQYYSTEKMNVI